jgi:hypothetical protein
MTGTIEPNTAVLVGGAGIKATEKQNKLAPLVIHLPMSSDKHVSPCYSV